MTTPTSYHDGLQQVKDALKYGDIGFGYPEEIRLGEYTVVYKTGPLGFMLTEDQFNTLVGTPQAHINMKDEIEQAFGMEMSDVVELISYWNHLAVCIKGGLPIDRIDAQEARIMYDAFLDSLLENRKDYKLQG